jgi:lysozyme
VKPIVIDISHHNSVVSWDALKAAGIQGVIHKATQGVHYSDEQYVSRRGPACAAGLRWGAYHFATNGDPKAQVAYFLDHAKPDGDTLLALDWERNPDGPDMSVDQARAFLVELMTHTGREPKGIVIYSGDVAKEMIRSDDDVAFFKAFPLWLCQYGPTPNLPKAWTRFTFWQFTETGKIDGMAPDGHVDLNYFNDGIGDLASAWTGKPTPTAPASQPS